MVCGREGRKKVERGRRGGLMSLLEGEGCAGMVLKLKEASEEETVEGE